MSQTNEIMISEVEITVMLTDEGFKFSSTGKYLQQPGLAEAINLAIQETIGASGQGLVECLNYQQLMTESMEAEVENNLNSVMDNLAPESK